MPNINVSQRFVPSQAERLKFAAIDNAYLESIGYPTTGERDGRFAVFTYNLNPDVINLSGTTLNVSVCDVAIDNWNELIAETYTGQPLSANVSVTNFNEATSVYVTNLNEISAITVTNLNEISAVRTIIPDTIWIGSSTIAAGDIITYNSVPNLREIEIQNRSEESIFFIASATDYTNTCNLGIEIFAGTFYSTVKDFKNGVTVASPSGGNIRVLGYYIG